MAEPEEPVEAETKQRIFPSAYAAFVTGCLIPSVSPWVDRFQAQGVSNILVFLYALAAIILPTLVSVFDLRQMRRYSWNPFLPWHRHPPWEKTLEEAIPTWGRMLAWFLGAVLSTFARYGLRP